MTEEEKQQCLADGFTPEQIRQIEAKRKRDAEDAWHTVEVLAKDIRAEQTKYRNKFADMTNPDVYRAHTNFFVYIANEVILKQQNRKFEIDDNNRDVLRFLLYYFNNCPLAEEVYPNKGYKLYNHIMLTGKSGAGKTMMMQVFSEYLRRTKNPNYFHNISVTELTNHNTICNNINLYTYNEDPNQAFMSKPVNICLNDIGVTNRKFYGIDTTTLIEDFLHARNEIWTQTAVDARKFGHLTTNLSQKQLIAMFSDEFGRLIDRFKTYNIIHLTGDSRR